MARDRIKSLRRVRAGDLLPNPRNWRRHPPAQIQAMRAALSEIGYADALLVRETKKGLQLIEGICGRGSSLSRRCLSWCWT